MKKKDVKLLVVLSLLVTVFTMGISLTSGGSIVSNYLADYLYNRTSPENGICIVIGIDQYSINELGDWPWSREVMAEVIEILNADEMCQPAAIAIDVVFAGETTEEADQRLADALAASDNVIISTIANFSGELSLDDDGVYYMDEFKVDSMTEPYEEFDALVGHVNAMYDNDGVLRHHLFSFEYEGETVLSLPYQAYLLWCEDQGIEADFDPDTDENGFWYVEYQRQPGDYYTYSVMDILNGTYDPDMLDGAVVLIGTYELASMDYFTTSADRFEKMYGVGYVANVTDAMISGITKEYITVEFFCFSCLLLFIYSYFLIGKRIKKGVMIYIGINIVTIFSYQLLYEIGYVVEPLWLLLGYALGLINSIVYHSLTENKRRKHISNVFSKYVDGDILEKLLDKDTETLGLYGKECNIAIMFVDIRGFGELSKDLTSTETVKLLNKYLTLTSKCIKKNEGVVDKFIENAAMAFWGAPYPCEEPVYKACKSALEIIEQSKQVGDDGVTFGIGIHYGPVIVGNIGTLDRMDFTAIGDTVNTANKIEDQTPKQSIYISEIVKEMLGERARVSPIEELLELKGKEEPAQVYRLEEIY